jgi:hypothetical protein
LTYHTEQIVAHQLGGGDGNLALACYDRNAHKGPNLTRKAAHTRPVVSSAPRPMG